MRLPLSMSPTALTPTATESCAEYRLRLRGNYRDKDVPRYDLNIAIFDTIRYIVPSLKMSKQKTDELNTSKNVDKICESQKCEMHRTPWTTAENSTLALSHIMTHDVILSDVYM